VCSSDLQTIYVKAAAGTYTLRIADRTIDSRTATTTLVALSGTPINGDSWTIVINGEKLAEVFVNTGGGPATVAQIATALASYINARNDDPVSESAEFAGFVAAADGDILVIVNVAGTGFQAALRIITQATNPTAGVEEVRDATSAAVLSGTLIEGDSWNFTVAGHLFALPVGAADTLATMAGRLAAAINAGLAPSYLAIAAGSTVIVVDRAAPLARPAISLSIALKPSPGTGVSAGTGSSMVVDSHTAASVSVAFSGTPVLGESWGVTVGAFSYAVTIGTPVSPGSANLVDTLDEIAAALATAINASAPPALLATSEGGTLLIVDRDHSAGASGLPTSAATTATAALSGPVIAGQKWVLGIRIGAEQTAVSYTVRSGDTLALIAAGLRDAINAATDPVVASVVATAAAGTLQLSNALAFTASLAVTLPVAPAGDAVAVVRDGATTSLALAGTPKTGDRWIVTINGTQHVVTVGGSIATLGQIGAALAQAIDASAGSGFTAFFAGSTLYVIERSGAAFTSDALVALATTTQGVISAPATGKAVSLGLSGDPLTGESWRLSIDGGVPYVVVIGTPVSTGSSNLVDTLDEIAQALAGAVNAAAGDIVAMPVGSTLVLVSRSATTFTAAFELRLTAPAGAPAASVAVATAASATVTLSGTPLAGDIWSVTANGHTATYTAAGGETLNAIAMALAGAVNGLAGANLLAVVPDGNQVIALVSTTR
jgi:phage tail sheath gpL-like